MAGPLLSRILGGLFRLRDASDPTRVASVSADGKVSTADAALAARIGEVQASPTTNTVLYWLKSIATALAGTLTVRGPAYRAVASFNRPANTTAYDAGDVVGPSAAALTFADIGPAAGGHVWITKADLEIDIASFPSGMGDFRLELYSVTPPSALADGATWSLASNDVASHVGTIVLGTPVALGAALKCTAAGINQQFYVPAGGSLYSYLVTTGAHGTTSAAAYKISLFSVAP